MVGSATLNVAREVQVCERLEYNKIHNDYM